jgi:hypothetical protein
MALTLTAEQTAPDTWAFDLSGVTAAQFEMDFGDQLGPFTYPADGDPATIHTVSHTYTRPGAHTYTVTASAAVVPWAALLEQIPARAPALSGIPAQVIALQEMAHDLDTATITVSVQVGPATITASVQPGQPPYVELDLWAGDPAGTISWVVTRLTSDPGVPIRAGRVFSGALRFADYSAPLGVPVSYRFDLEWSDGRRVSVRSSDVILSGTVGCWLSNPYSRTALNITVESWPSRDSAERQTVLGIQGRGDPVVLSDVHLWPSGTWTLITRTKAELTQLYTILKTSRVVLLRTQPTSAIETVYAAVGRIVENRHTGSGADWTRRTTVEIQEIGPIPATGADFAATLQSLHDSVPGTLADMAAYRPTLLTLSQARPGGGGF